MKVQTRVLLLLMFMLCTASPTLAQTTYKVGEKIEAMSAGKWFPATIIEVKNDGTYVIRYDGSEDSFPSTEKWLRKKQAPGATTPPQERSSPLISDENTVGERYGAREPRTCDDTKAPAKGPITASLAAKYFTCGYEGEASSLLYLVDNVKLEVGGAIPYRAIRDHRSLPQIDVNQPVYPFRGSYTRYVFNRIYNRNDQPRYTVEKVPVEGYCYRTTFGEWKCR